MSSHDQQSPANEVKTELSTDHRSLLTRRTVLRRSTLGLTGVSLASLLSACGWWEDEEDDGEDNGEVVEEEENGAVEGSPEDAEEEEDEGI